MLPPSDLFSVHAVLITENGTSYLFLDMEFSSLKEVLNGVKISEGDHNRS